MIDLTTITFFDYTVVLILLFSAIFSTLRGMTREFLGLVGWAISVLVAHLVKPVLEGPIVDLTRAEGLSAILAWTIPFVLTVIVWFILASILSPGLTRAVLGSLDRWLALGFGLIRGYFLVVLAFVGAVIALGSEAKLYDAIKDAQSTPIISKSARFLAGLGTENQRKQLLSKLSLHDMDSMPLSSTIDSAIATGKKITEKPMELLSDEKTD